MPQYIHPEFFGKYRIEEQTMRLYLDTEFTDLVPGAKLISIALVDENEDFFYAELTDTYKKSNCSLFVKENVLPHLRGKEYQMTFAECALRIGNWIESRNTRCVIASDNPNWDLPYLESLIDICWPENLVRDLIFPVYVPYIIQEKVILENEYTIHNALDDALTMKKSTEIQEKNNY